MDSSNTTNESLAIVAVIISGVFGIVISFFSWELVNHREKKKFKHEQFLKDYKEKEAFYISILELLDKVIRCIQNGLTYSEMIAELSNNSAKIDLLASDTVRLKYADVSGILAFWHSEYKQFLPEKIPGTNLGMVSTENFKHKDKADEFYELLLKEKAELIEMIKKELKDYKMKIDK